MKGGYQISVGGSGTTSPLTTKGDIYVYGAGNTRLPVGVNGQVLMADSTEATGLIWGVPAGGAGATEAGTSVRLGTGTVMNNTKNAIYGISSTGQGINATVYGAASHGGQSNVIVGSDNFTSATTVSTMIIVGNGATTVKAGSSNNAIIISPLFTSANGTGGIYIGRDVNVTSSAPTNAATNNGVYIGRGVTHIGGSSAGGVLIGYNANGRNGTYPVLIGHSITTADGLQNSIAIGYQSSVIDGQPLAVVIGQEAKAFLDSTYGTTGGHQVSIGYKTFAGSWRATAVGSHAQALAVSSTAKGYGSFASGDHGSVDGRGGYNDLANATLIYTGATNTTVVSKVYLGAVAGAWTNPAMPSTETVDMAVSLNAGTVITKVYGIPGRDARPVPVNSNTRGGHLRITGGNSTGTAIGGDVQIATTPASGVSSNTENNEVVCASFDSVATGGAEETRFLLLDLSDGSLKRVSFGADDSGGTGFKLLRVTN